MSRHALSASSDATFKKLFCIVDDTSSLARESLRDLSQLFTAIKAISEEHSTVHALAGIGQYLADDRINLNDLQREELDAQLASLYPIHSEGVAA